ncbi:MAG: helix-turn-helix domain-containing protein [Roseiarcus sp.]
MLKPDTAMVSTFLGFAANSTSHGSAHRSRRRLRSGRHFVLATPRPQGARIGNVLFSEGDPADEVFEVLKGAVVVSRSLTGGRRQIIDVVGPGRMVGFTARRAHECTAIAQTATELIAFDRFSAQNWKDEDLGFNTAILTEIDRLRRLVSLLGRKTAIERLATFLADLLGDGEGSQVVRLLLSRQEIADHLGLAVETVSRGFLTLKQCGVIARAGRTSVTVLDCSALRGIGAGDGETIA